jgi:predicted TIM-barrel enzyme
VTGESLAAGESDPNKSGRQQSCKQMNEMRVKLEKSGEKMHLSITLFAAKKKGMGSITFIFPVKSNKRAVLVGVKIDKNVL